MKKKSLCWPGLPLSCGGRLSRAFHSANEFDYDTENVNDINADNNMLKSLCWPGLPWPCTKRLSRNFHSANEFDHDTQKANDINADNNMLKDSKDYEPLYDTDSVADVNADKYDEMSDDNDKR